MCDYTSGFRPPEMVKLRLAVTVSPKLKRRNDLVTIVPLSQTCPTILEAWHHRIEVDLPPPWGSGARWAKCDMLATVGYARLNLPYMEHPVTGSRQFVQRQLTGTDVVALRRACAAALGIVIEGYPPCGYIRTVPALPGLLGIRLKSKLAWRSPGVASTRLDESPSQAIG